MTFKIDLESEIEKKFVKECQRYGGVVRKQMAGGGDLDRRVIWPKGVTTYAEVKKRKGGKRSQAQQDEVGLLLSMGHLAMFVENELDIARFIRASLERVMNQP